jgi:DnaJ-domain-containing protein 1
MYKPDNHIDKWMVEVEISFSDGARQLGFLFVRPRQRLSDLLNDDRRFLPFRLPDGHIEQIAKDTILRAAPLYKDDQSEAIGDPYAFLGVRRNIADPKLKKIYRRLCKENHPDRLLSLGMAPEIVEFSNARLRRVIDAYRRIMTQRHGRSAAEAAAEAAATDAAAEAAAAGTTTWN